MLQDELQHMARENEESHKNMHQFVRFPFCFMVLRRRTQNRYEKVTICRFDHKHCEVQKILTIDDAAKEFGRTKQGHDDSMRHMRSDHDHLSSQLVFTFTFILIFFTILCETQHFRSRFLNVFVFFAIIFDRFVKGTKAAWIVRDGEEK